MKKILGLTIAALLIIALVGGGTWAYFQDTENSENNTITAGTLDLNWNGNNDQGEYVFQIEAADAYPGNSGSGYKALKNVGTFTGELDVTFSRIANVESNGTTEYENDANPGASESGTADGGSTTTVEDSSKSWGVNAYAGYAVVVTGVGTSVVVSNTATELTVSPAFPSAVSDQAYRISKGELGAVAQIAVYIDKDKSEDWTDGDVGLKSDGTTYSYVANVTGTADSGSKTTLVHDALTQADDFFNGMLLVITGGTNSGEKRLITDFDADTDTITVASPFTAAIADDSQYAIWNLNFAAIDSYGSDNFNAAIASMAANDEYYFAINWEIPFGIAADNSFQGDSLTFDITFKLEQAAVD